MNIDDKYFLYVASRKMCLQNMSRNGDHAMSLLNTGLKIGSKAITLQFENDFSNLIIADKCTYVRWESIFVSVMSSKSFHGLHKLLNLPIFNW